jgi:hypothetical protein
MKHPAVQAALLPPGKAPGGKRDSLPGEGIPAPGERETEISRSSVKENEPLRRAMVSEKGSLRVVSVVSK